jgi:hypothetical protein
LKKRRGPGLSGPKEGVDLLGKTIEWQGNRLAFFVIVMPKRQIVVD